MIRDFYDRQTALLFEGRLPKGYPADIARIAKRKLLQLDKATALDDLRVPPGNRLEELKKDRKGQWSIRVNDQWRICFKWQDGNASRVEFCDYH